jgi:hypothetical protein
VLSLSISDANKKILIRAPLLPLLTRTLELYRDNSPALYTDSGGALGGGDDIESADIALETLFQLAFFFESDKMLQSQYMTPDLRIAELLSAILSLPSDRKRVSLNARLCAKSLLQRLTSSEEAKSPLASADAVTVSSFASVPMSPVSAKKTHVMLSYAWSSEKPRVLLLEQMLRAHGYDVWRDESGSSILSGMSGGLLYIAVVLLYFFPQ